MQRIKIYLLGLVLLCALAAVCVAGFLTNYHAEAVPSPTGETDLFSAHALSDIGNFLAATKPSHFEEVLVSSVGTLSGNYWRSDTTARFTGPLAWNTSDSSPLVASLWSSDSGGNTDSFGLSASHSAFASLSGLRLARNGSAAGRGVVGSASTGRGAELSGGTLDTTGDEDSASDAGKKSASPSFSTAEAPIRVPDGGSTLLLLGGALCGVLLIKRKLAA